MPQRRQSTRQKSLLRGIVYLDNHACAVECLVRDISEAGARIQFSDPPAPTIERLELQIPVKALTHRCRIVWRSEDELGLAFIDVIADQDSLAEQIACLKTEIESLKRIVRALQRDKAASAA